MKHENFAIPFCFLQNESFAFYSMKLHESFAEWKFCFLQNESLLFAAWNFCRMKILFFAVWKFCKYFLLWSPNLQHESFANSSLVFQNENFANSFCFLWHESFAEWKFCFLQNEVLQNESFNFWSMKISQSLFAFCRMKVLLFAAWKFCKHFLFFAAWKFCKRFLRQDKQVWTLDYWHIAVYANHSATRYLLYHNLKKRNTYFKSFFFKWRSVTYEDGHFFATDRGTLKILGPEK